MSQDAHRAEARGEITRRAISSAAAALFADRGFSATSVRDIGKAAGVDPALVIRYFGSKEALFLRTLTVHDVLAGLTDVPQEDLGPVLLRRMLASRNERGKNGAWVNLIRAAERPEVRAYLREAGERYLVTPLAARMTGPEVRLRAHLVASQVIGLLNSLYALETPELQDAETEQVVELYGPALQTLIDG